MVKVSEIAGKMYKARLKKPAFALLIAAAAVLCWQYRHPLRAAFAAGRAFAERQIGAFLKENGRPELFDMPVLNVNIRNHRRLKIGITLELANPKEKEYVRSLLPKLNDAVIGDGAVLLPQELEVAENIHFLKEELLYRFNLIAYPAAIDRLYFRQFELLP